jgi:aminotransferase
MGPKTAELERALATHLEVDDFVLLNSGSNSLQMAVHLLGIPGGTGAEIIVPSFTWVACASAVLLCGHRPVFCDVNASTMNLDAATVERVLTPRTAGIIAVHYAGLPAPLGELARFGVPIIEDAAHAIDSRLAGRACGTIGDIGIFSFDAVKNLAMGEGGGVFARDPDHLRRARDLRQCGVARSGFEAAQQQGRWWEHEIIEAFPKMVTSDIAAAIGLAQLRKLKTLQLRRAAIWEHYQRELSDISWIRNPEGPRAGDQHSWFTYCVRIMGGGRDRLAGHLLDRGIYTTLRFHPLHLSAVYHCPAPLPVAEQLGREALSLPLHPRLSDHDVERVIDAIRTFHH